MTASKLIDPDASAFPLVPRGTSQTEFGLTKREYFYACAMQGILSNSDIMGSFADEKTDPDEVQEIVVKLTSGFANLIMTKLSKP